VIRCSQARQWFGAYWDDETTQAERERLEAHFAGCPACRKEYEELARALEWTAGLPRHEVAPDFLERTLARIRRTVPAPDRLGLERPAWVPVAAAATVLVLVATLLAPWLGVRVRPPTPVAERVASPREPQLVSRVGTAGASAERRARGAEGMAPSAALVDSIIDHSEDVNFVLEPVRVSRGRTAASRLTGPAQGQQAVITF
jgi:anti-sigma factor RsiW